jgi:hypothetical protein
VGSSDLAKRSIIMPLRKAPPAPKLVSRQVPIGSDSTTAGAEATHMTVTLRGDYDIYGEKK